MRVYSPGWSEPDEDVARRPFGVRFKGFTLGLIVLASIGSKSAAIRQALPTTPSPAAIAAGDTVVVYGPRRFTAPSGRQSRYAESFSVGLKPGQQYKLRIINGSKDGRARADSAAVTLNGTLSVDWTFKPPEAERTVVVAIREQDTIAVTVAGPRGSFVTVSILSEPDPTFIVFDQRQYSIRAGSSEVYDTTFAIPATAQAPYLMYILNGSSSGTQRVSGGLVTINGIQMLGMAAPGGRIVGSTVQTVPLQSQNVLRVALSGEINSRVTLWFAATKPKANPRASFGP